MCVSRDEGSGRIEEEREERVAIGLDKRLPSFGRLRGYTVGGWRPLLCSSKGPRVPLVHLMGLIFRGWPRLR